MPSLVIDRTLLAEVESDLSNLQNLKYLMSFDSKKRKHGLKIATIVHVSVEAWAVKIFKQTKWSPIIVLIFNSQKVDNLCYVVVGERSDFRETAKRPGLTENVKVQLNRLVIFTALLFTSFDSMIDLFLRQYFVAFIVENKQTKKDGRAECYVIETDHQLELEFPSILNSNDKLQRELFIYFASNVN